MLESFAAWVLNTYLGEYVEDLNTDQLSIGIVQGEVNLENLPIKKDALKYLDLPLEVRTGYIGSVKLQIPWSGLKSQPTVISIERLYLVVGPLTSFSYNVAEEEAQDQARKQQQLKTLEAKWKAQREAQEATGSLWWTMGASLATNILENVQLRVKDVHIRYEDKTTIEGETFACGVSIKSLTAQSTDNQWEPKFVSREGADMMFKLVGLKDFAVYWDAGSTLYGDMDRAQFCDPATATFYEFSTAPFKYNSSGFTGMLYASVLVNMYGFQGWSASCILFITTCYVLSKELDLLNISVKKATGKDGSFAGNLELLRRQHDVICQMVGVADDIFCYYIGISMTAVVMLACLLLYGFARGVTNPILLMGLVGQAISVVNVTVILVVGCVAVSSQATSVVEYLFRINLDLMDPATINKIQVFLLRVTGSPIGLTTSRLFVLDKGAILTIVGTVVTYAVVLFQMPTSPTPSATSVCNETCLSK